MTHFKLLFEHDYVGAWDLEGGEKTVVIDRIAVEDLKSVDGQTKKKPVVSFRGAKRRLILNKVNAQTIADLYGPDVDKWVGKPITLIATTTNAFGKTVECIRVKPERPAGNGKKRGLAPSEQAIEDSEPVHDSAAPDMH